MRRGRVERSEDLSHVGARVVHVGFRVYLASSFTILSHSFDLILYFLEDRGWRCRHAIEVLHVQFAEFIT